MQGLKMEHVDALLRFCKDSGYAEIDLPGRRLVRDAGRLWLDVPELQRLEDTVLIPGQSLELPGLGLRLHCEICDYMGEVNDLFKTSYLKYEIIGTDIQITSWQSGDRLRPAGRGCTKSLKALFLEKKIPVFRRGSIPVLRDENGILLVHGIALDQRAVPTPGEKALKINFLNTDTGEN
jgi:tRNA(Ile)-lysidine synthase